MDCKEMLNVRAVQLDERARFLHYQAGIMSDTRAQCDRIKARKRVEWDRIITEHIDKVSS